MKHTMLGYLIISILLTFPLGTQSLQAQTNSLILSGSVINKQDKEKLAFASIVVMQQGRFITGTTSDYAGNFKLNKLKPGQYQLKVSFVGFHTSMVNVQLTANKQLNLVITPESYALKEVVVTASESKGITSASKIDRTAMEHLQPTSFTDVLALLPGGSTETPNMNNPNSIRLREAAISSSDYNTSSLGTQFVVDGTPINTDANMQRVRTEITQNFDSKTSVNSGVDMRTISTDNIESIEIIRGIPSVEYGDLTSGLVVIKRKLKETPVEARFKADQYSMLFSAGKGLEWKEKDISLAFDGGFLNSQNDPRNKLNNYKRINFSTRFQKGWNSSTGDRFRFNSSVDYSGNIDASKNDPEILTQPEDKFKSTYHSVKWQNMFRWTSDGDSFFRNFTANFSASTSKDKIERTRFVQLDRDRIAVTNHHEGSYDAVILPYKYTANHIVDGQPLNLYANAKAEFQINLGEMSNRVVTGATWTYAKNLGDGEVYDLARPLNPLTTSSRPRKYSDIPAGEQFSFYLEDRIHWPIAKHLLSLQAGLRGNMLLNLRKEYLLHGKVYLDPRLNIQWKFPGIKLGEKELAFNLSGGVGGLTKMPTLLHLYPDKVYLDFMQLNYWHANSQYKRMNLYTYIEDPTNYDLKPARNFKWEVRLGAEFDKNEFSVTYFRERMNSGFRSMAVYAPYQFKEYDASGVDGDKLTAPPSIENMPFTEKKILGGYGYVGNGSRTLKEGVEFQFASKRFSVINTRLTVNGAWFKTTYQNSVPVYKSVSKVINNVAISDQYMGLYENEDNYVNQRFNTNFIIDTWLSRIGVKLSETIECSWFQSRELGRLSGVPIAYMDLSGNLKPYTEADKTHIYKRHLVIPYNDGQFEKNTNPFYMYVNFKATKDFGNHVTIALFADRILDYVPNYKRKGYLIRRTALSPYFGMEINFKL